MRRLFPGNVKMTLSKFATNLVSQRPRSARALLRLLSYVPFSLLIANHNLLTTFDSVRAKVVNSTRLHLRGLELKENGLFI